MADHSQTTTQFELAEVIKALRQELLTAQTEGQDKDIRFNVTGVEVELQTVVTENEGGGVKLKFLVVDADGSVKHENSTTHKIKLSLQAVNVVKNPDGTTTTNAVQINDKA